MRGIGEIERVDSGMATRIMREGGFISVADVKKLATLLPHLQILVRCNNGRFVTAAQNVIHFTEMIEQHYKMMEAAGHDPLMKSDYVRDISLLAEEKKNYSTPYSRYA